MMDAVDICDDEQTSPASDNDDFVDNYDYYSVSMSQIDERQERLNHHYPEPLEMDANG